MTEDFYVKRFRDYLSKPMYKLALEQLEQDKAFEKVKKYENK